MLATPAEGVDGLSGGWLRAHPVEWADQATPANRPMPGDPHVWWWQSPAQPDPADVELLDAAERDQVGRYRHPIDAASFAARRAHTRRILAGYLDVTAATVRTGRRPCPRCGSDRHGPPDVPWPPSDLQISVSASRGRGVLAVAAGHPVGVDVQAHGEVQVDSLQRVVCTRAEQQVLAAAAAPRRLALFLRAWARKEAVVKAIGVGLVVDLTTVEVHPDQSGPISVAVGQVPPGIADDGGKQHLPAGSWRVCDVDVGTGWYAAVAVPAQA